MSCSNSSEGSIGGSGIQSIFPLTYSLSDSLSKIGGMVIEIISDNREDLVEELVENDLSHKGGYKWVSVVVRGQFSLDRWSRILNSLLQSFCVFEKGMPSDIVSLQRVSVIDNVCHGREQYDGDFFYMYMCHFVQLHIWLSFYDFTMGVLRLFNVSPTQLRPSN